MLQSFVLTRGQAAHYSAGAAEFPCHPGEGGAGGAQVAPSRLARTLRPFRRGGDA